MSKSMFEDDFWQDAIQEALKMDSVKSQNEMEKDLWQEILNNRRPPLQIIVTLIISPPLI